MQGGLADFDPTQFAAPASKSGLPVWTLLHRQASVQSALDNRILWKADREQASLVSLSTSLCLLRILKTLRERDPLNKVFIRYSKKQGT
jgi:hypothetical protein